MSKACSFTLPSGKVTRAQPGPQAHRPWLAGCLGSSHLDLDGPEDFAKTLRQRHVFLFHRQEQPSATESPAVSCLTGRCFEDGVASVWVCVCAWRHWECCASASQVRGGIVVMVVCGDAYSFLGSNQAASVLKTHTDFHLWAPQAANLLYLSFYFFICKMGLKHSML